MPSLSTGTPYPRDYYQRGLSSSQVHSTILRAERTTMFVRTPSGFNGAPVTQNIICLSAVSAVIISILEIQYLFSLSLAPDLTEWRQYWRVALNQLICVTQTNMLLSILLLYNFRVLERLMGSAKFLSFVVLVYVLGCFIVPAILYLCSLVPFLKDFINGVPPNQSVVLFALLSLYHSLVPPIYKFRIAGSFSPAAGGGLLFTDKVFIYIVALQPVLTGFPGSIVPAISGWTLGSLLHREILPGKNWRIPGSPKLFRPHATYGAIAETPAEEEQATEGSILANRVLNSFRGT